jgi:hypothetical protein
LLGASRPSALLRPAPLLSIHAVFFFSDRRLAVPVLACGLLASGLAAGAMIPSLRSADWNMSVLPRVDARSTLGAEARALDPGFRTVRAGAYDGQFYWGVAVDPLALGPAHKDFDKASYRYGHPLYGWLGWLFSEGRARAVPGALALVSLMALFVGAAFAAALGVRRGTSGWEGLFVALNPGLIVATTHDLAEALAAALLVGAIWAYVSGRRTAAWLCLALLPLAKEPLLVAPLAIAAGELLQQRGRRAAFFATAVLPALLWWIYTRIRLGAWFTTGATALGRPFGGWWRALFAADASHFAVVLALVVLLAVVGLRALRNPGPVELVYVALAAVGICLAPNATLAFTTALRNTAMLVVLIPFVISAPQLMPRGLGRATPSH